MTEFQGKYFVYTVDKNILFIRRVELGITYKDYWVVESGLESSDQVVFEGFKRKEGLTIHPETVNISSKLAINNMSKSS